ncbi:MAG: hypothetical protein KDD69_18195 [Bdellovibrionales bacterium]|nr:hypothetical protein [Bdellovibrionales bacterium]
MKLSRESATTMLHSHGWQALSITAEYFVSDTSPLGIKLMDGEVQVYQKENARLTMEQRTFPCTEQGLAEAILAASHVRISLQ